MCQPNVARPGIAAGLAPRGLRAAPVVHRQLEIVAVGQAEAAGGEVAVAGNVARDPRFRAEARAAVATGAVPHVPRAGPLVHPADAHIARAGATGDRREAVLHTARSQRDVLPRGVGCAVVGGAREVDALGGVVGLVGGGVPEQVYRVVTADGEGQLRAEKGEAAVGARVRCAARAYQGQAPRLAAVGGAAHVQMDWALGLAVLRIAVEGEVDGPKRVNAPAATERPAELSAPVVDELGGPRGAAVLRDGGIDLLHGIEGHGDGLPPHRQDVLVGRALEVFDDGWATPGLPEVGGLHDGNG